MKAAHRLALLHGALLAVGCAHPRPAVPPRSAPPTPFAGLQRGMQVVMGTRLFVALEPPAGADGAALLAEVFSIARAHDGLLSNYQPDSALSRLNRRDGGPLRAPAELLRFLRRGQRYCAATAGAFDLTVGALTSPQARLTRSERLALARRTVGCDKLRIDGRDASLPPGTRIDPGGLGKGYALDAMVARLRARGCVAPSSTSGAAASMGWAHLEAKPVGPCCSIEQLSDATAPPVAAPCCAIPGSRHRRRSPTGGARTSSTHAAAGSFACHGWRSSRAPRPATPRPSPRR